MPSSRRSTSRSTSSVVSSASCRRDDAGAQEGRAPDGARHAADAAGDGHRHALEDGRRASTAIQRLPLLHHPVEAAASEMPKSPSPQTPSRSAKYCLVLDCHIRQRADEEFGGFDTRPRHTVVLSLVNDSRRLSADSMLSRSAMRDGSRSAAPRPVRDYPRQLATRDRPGCDRTSAASEKSSRSVSPFCVITQVMPAAVAASRPLRESSTTTQPAARDRAVRRRSCRCRAPASSPRRCRRRRRRRSRRRYPRRRRVEHRLHRGERRRRADGDRPARVERLARRAAARRDVQAWRRMRPAV